jgi:hypothetical protein
MLPPLKQALREWNKKDKKTILFHAVIVLAFNGISIATQETASPKMTPFEFLLLMLDSND